MNPLITRFQKHWAGPPVVIKRPSGATLLTLGQGDPAATLIVHNPAVLRRIWRTPSLVFGEAYMNGDIEVQGDLMALLSGFHQTGVRYAQTPEATAARWIRKFMPQKIGVGAAKKNAAHHYDIGNEFYKLWLDPSLTYTCAYFLNENDSLAQAQKQKLELVARKVRLEPGQHIIDLGCGWGSFLFHAVEQHGVHATGVVAAKEQGNYIEAEARKRGLSDKINVVIDDWRSASTAYNNGKPFDRVVSIGIIEHVGAAHYAEFLRLYRDLLVDDGMAFLHGIGRQLPIRPEPWVLKYIFPGGSLPTIGQLVEQAGRHHLVVTDIENLWQHYALTLQHWYQNFAAHEKEVRAMFDDEFIRMWTLYLRGSEAGFSWGGMQLWQLVMIKNKMVRWPLNREVNTASVGQ